MVARLATRMLLETDKRALWKFAYNFGFKGMRSVQKYKKRLKEGVYFPPFLFISIINSCQLRCQGCWVDVASPRQMIPLGELDKLITDAKRHGNSYFGILGGEPFMHPGLLELLGRHPDCYFQIFTNGQLITDEVAKKLRRLGNATPLISIEGSEVVSNERRGGKDVLNKTLAGVENCVNNKLIVGVASSICQTNYDLVSEDWLNRLIEMGVHYVWFHTYRVVGPEPSPELALTPDQVVSIRRFIVEMRTKMPIGIVEPYWDDRGQALCPMSTGVSHHIGPSGAIEPCPIIQFATENIHDGPDVYQLMSKSEFLDDFRRTSAEATRGCVVLERPDLVRDLVHRHSAGDTTQRGTALAELDRLEPRGSQHSPGAEIPEKQWLYRFAKKHWYFGFGAYT
ncbi:pyrroloquinoline quinone biosynthesis protein PqqE [Posidoniimonas corsicana]|uniref:Pyrroloquinoline quinone biosynthesis protein PqqE n=1 Tax=Posidoniimonas corsicana TaxID=1938618 RepID=A0A5C5VD76_9BACT|nr:radical SAM/SPASM domain-containing protein [Posidoniimonas corsicana]TWT36548.1 pyrroloquinoline quinone biosynthesis protein PqqE [Posidoniimonas corsicana]